MMMTDSPTRLRVEVLRARIATLELEQQAHEARYGFGCTCDDDGYRIADLEENQKALAREERRMLEESFSG
jgi:hypothetical protein